MSRKRAFLLSSGFLFAFLSFSHEGKAVEADCFVLSPSTGLPIPCLATPGGAFIIDGNTSGSAHNLDIATVTTGSTPVAALSAAHCAGGCFIYNPGTATKDLCISETGTAGISESTAGTKCIPPTFSYWVKGQAGAVSVNSSDSSHVFSGVGYY